MMDPMDIRGKMLGAKAGIKEPKIAEIKIDADVKDFDESLDEIAKRCDALISIAPPDKIEGLQNICEDLAKLKHQGPVMDDEDTGLGMKKEKPEVEVDEVPSDEDGDEHDYR